MLRSSARTKKDLTPLPVPRRSALRAFNAQSGVILAAAVTMLLAGCGRVGADWREGRSDPQKDAPASASGYIRPPQITAASRNGDAAAVLSGQGEPDVRLRLASPDGGAYGATADDTGHWTLTLPASTDVRLFGLSEEVAGRVVQGEGYVAVLPPPGRPAVLLRAGGGAAPLIDQETLEITAIDFDSAGGAVISGAAKAGLALRAVIDGTAAGESHANAHNHFVIALTSALKPGDHQVQVQSAGAAATASINVSPTPAAITGLPYRGARFDSGWRLDWLTPGGGPQTTLVLDPAGTMP
jgi:hypothetical protein